MNPLPHALELMLAGVQPSTRAQIEAWWLSLARADPLADLTPAEADAAKQRIDALERAALARRPDAAPAALAAGDRRAKIVADIKAGVGRRLGEAAEAADGGWVRTAVKWGLGGLLTYAGWRLGHGVVRDIARTRREWRSGP
jgi:hypothetical protein